MNLTRPVIAIQLCWRIKPDVDVLLRDVVPAQPAAYLAFLNLLMTPKKVDLSTTTAPSNPSGKRWVYTLEAAETRADSNAWAECLGFAFWLYWGRDWEQRHGHDRG